MLGHQLWRHLGARHEVTVALRRRSATFARYGLFVGSHAIEGFDAMDEASIAATVERARPDAVVNSVGIIKQVAEAKDPSSASRSTRCYRTCWRGPASR
jgi:dTDP-4-dehydrorhamnose reductase